MARFEREAKVLASLNHPNIAHIYGVEDRALVVELVEGPTLAERIAGGALPMDEALSIGEQITEALEAAHERGITHRDLKPANVKITPQGAVKVLDFGLATAASSPELDGNPSISPTLTLDYAGTRPGMILGTAAYMSPEQAVGRPVDRRSDIWSFGVLLFEMLTGRRLFHGETTSHVLAEVIKGGIDFSKLPSSTPRTIRELVKRCLDRNVKSRLQWIGEARIALNNAAKEPEPAIPAVPMPRQSALRWVAAAVLVVSLALSVFVLFRATPREAPIVRTFIPPPERAVFNITASFNSSGPVALSPDGRSVVFSARTADGKNQLWIRPLDALSARPLPGTESATMPFWSPDSRYVAFFAGGKLKKVDAVGSPPITLCDAPQGRGGTWNQDGVIVFAPTNAGPLHRVSAAGGTSNPVTSLDRTAGATSHRVPWFLPDGRHFLYLAAGGESTAAIYVGSVDGKGNSKVVEALSNGIYSNGHLLFLIEDTLMAQPFDLKHLTTAGEAVPVAEGVRSIGAERVGVFSASSNGLLVYRAGRAEGGSELTWFDRSGRQVGTLGDPARFYSLNLSPSGKSVAVSTFDSFRRTDSNIWLYDVARGLRTRFTFDSGPNRYAIWSHDGNALIFDSVRKGPADLYRKAFTGIETEELVYSDKSGKFPTS